MEYLKMDPVRPAEDWDGIIYLNQAALPNRTEWKIARKTPDFYNAIKTLEVRGAPCIGIFAGYAVAYLASKALGDTNDFQSFLSSLGQEGDYLVSSRPTAVNLKYAVDRMLLCARDSEDHYPDGLLKRLEEEAQTIHMEDIAMCRRISEHGLELVHDGDGILTHCNAGALATSRYGTALGPILLGAERGINFKVFSDETRPLLQGARITAYELMSANVDVTLICDNMASIVMKEGKIDACFVGADRIAANGDTANKIGTSGVAILAHHYGIPFYVFAPSSTIDFDTPNGEAIVIEKRDPSEIRSLFYKEPMAPLGVKAYNPAFDVTDNSLISAIVTDKGIIRPPFEKNLGVIRDK